MAIKRTLTIKDQTYEEIEQLYYAEKHFYETGGDLGYLIDLLCSDVELYGETREFIASVLAGKTKKNPGRIKPNYYRDLRVHKHIAVLLSEGTPLTSSINKDGAAAQVSSYMGITEDAALKIYQRVCKAKKPKPINLDDYI